MPRKGYYQEEVSTYLVDLGGYYHYYDTNERRY